MMNWKTFNSPAERRRFRRIILTYTLIVILFWLAVAVYAWILHVQGIW